MSEQVWYLFQNGQQVGPFDTQQVTQLFVNKMISQDGYIFKVGWKDWRPLEEGLEELGLEKPEESQNPTEIEKRRKNSPRASVAGRIVIHNNGQLAIGKGVNISTTGLFVETKEQIFTVGEQLKLSVRCEGLDNAFNAEAQVIRYNTDARWPVGYGLQFVEINDKAKDGIQDLVDELNRAS